MTERKVGMHPALGLGFGQRNDKSILKDGKVVPATLEEWAQWFEKGDRVVAQTVISMRQRIGVSTVFLGLDHGFGGRPLWFETLVIGSSLHGDMDRYETLEEAKQGHARMIGRVRQCRWLRKPKEHFFFASKRKPRRLHPLAIER